VVLDVAQLEALCPGRSASGWTPAGAGRRSPWSGCGCPGRCPAPPRRRRWPPGPWPSSGAWRRSRSRRPRGWRFTPPRSGGRGYP